MTASISPLTAPSLTIRDSGQRLQQYTAALVDVCKQLTPDEAEILLVENTGFDLAVLRSAAAGLGHNLSCLSYTEPTDVVLQGKSVGEARMFDRVIAERLDNSRDYELVLKLTGRLKVRNLRQILAPRYAPPFFTALLRTDLALLDSRLMVADPHTWRSLCSDLASEVDESSGVFIEHVLASRLLMAVGSKAVTFVPFEREPLITGRSATTGDLYGGLPFQLVRLLRHGVARIAPFPYVSRF